MTRKVEGQFETVCRERGRTEEEGQCLSDACLGDPVGEKLRNDTGIGISEVTNNFRTVSAQQSSATRANPTRTCLTGQTRVSGANLQYKRDTQ